MNPIIPVVIIAGVLGLAYIKRKRIFYFINERRYDFLSDFTGFFSLVTCKLQGYQNKISKYPDRKGYVGVITGGGRGIGVFVVKGLMKCGIHVVVGVRNPDACEDLKRELLKEKLKGTIEILKLDVSSLKSVKKFANEVKQKHPEVHILINNAAIVFADFALTEDGFESHLGTNYIGHFYLTHLLMKNLKLSGRNKEVCSRIVNVSSCAHLVAGINFDDINSKQVYHKRRAYSQSKLAQLMMTRYINRNLEARHLPIRSYSIHPGIVDTTMTDVYKESWLVFWLMVLLKSPEEAAISVLYAALSEDLEGTGGQYISNCVEGFSSPFSKNEAYQKRLFEQTCEMLHIKTFGEEEK